MNSPISISIVTKTYNRFPLIVECVQSVQQLVLAPNEQYIQLEHVIIDDGSTDETVAYFKSHHFPNVRFVALPEHKGIAQAANIAIATCKADYIFELDSDDIVPQRVISNFYLSIINNPNAQWLIADFYRMNDRSQYQIGNDYYGWQYSDCNSILNAIFASSHFIQHNVIYRKDLWEKVGKYDQSLTMAEDLDLFIRFLLADNMPIYVPYISHFHRNHANNISKDINLTEHKLDIIKLYQKYKNQLQERLIYPPSS